MAYEENRQSGAERFSVEIADGVLAGLHWRNSDAPPLLFCHANGFCASAYRQVLAPLVRKFDIYALDMRGHGRTELPVAPEKLSSWRLFADDVGAFLDLQQRNGWTLAGHSLGAAVSLLASVGREDIAALRLIEAVIVPRWVRALAFTPAWPLIRPHMSVVKQASARRCVWPSREAAADSYRGRGAFRHFAPGVLEDYLEDGLEPSPEDGFGLACDPRWEAAIFAAQANRFWATLAGVPAPVAMYAANSSSSTTPVGVRERLVRKGVSLICDEDVSHLAPLENPAALSAFLAGETKSA